MRRSTVNGESSRISRTVQTRITSKVAYRYSIYGELRAADVGKTVLLTGWVAIRRDLGGMVFIDLQPPGLHS